MIDIALTTYNRPILTVSAFGEVYDDERINNIIIADDGSKVENIMILEKLIDRSFRDKVKFYRLDHVGMYQNKLRAVYRCTTPFVILFDSDNVLGSDYLDSIPQSLDTDTLYLPDQAMPAFDYREFAGQTFDKKSIKKILHHKMADALLNTCNWLCPRKNFIINFVENSSVGAADTMFYVYNWLKSGGKIKVVENMHYYHMVHDQSEFLKDVHYNMKMINAYKLMIGSL